MEINGDKIIIEFLDDVKDELHSYIVEEDCDPNASINTTKSAIEFDMGAVLDQNVLNASELDHLIDDVEALEDVAETFNDMSLNFNADDIIEEVIEEVIEEPIEQVLEIEEVPYICDTCSLDFPSLPYFKRHNTTKKHKRALDMERRGKKVNQKRKYVRKNSCKTRGVRVIPKQRLIQGAQLLHNSDLVQRIQPGRNIQITRPVQTIQKVEKVEPEQIIQTVQISEPVQAVAAAHPDQTVPQIQVLPATENYTEVQEPSFGDLDNIQGITDFLTEKDKDMSMKNFYENLDIVLDFNEFADIN